MEWDTIKPVRQWALHSNSEMHKNSAHKYTPYRLITQEKRFIGLAFLFFITYLFKTLKPAVMRADICFTKEEKLLCAHILILPMILSVNSIWQVGNLFFLKTHNSFSAVPLYYYTFYTVVHRKHCCFLNNSIPSSNHSCKGVLHENLWGQGGWIVAARKPGESWEENTRRGWEEKASGWGGGGSWRRNKDRRDN